MATTSIGSISDITAIGGSTTCTVTFNAGGLTNGLVGGSNITLGSPGSTLGGTVGNYTVTAPGGGLT